jgi:hypothetical protein
MNGGAHPIGGVVPLGGGAQGERLAHHGQVVRPGGPVQQQLRAQRSQAVRRRHPAGLALSVRRLLNQIVCCITQQTFLISFLMNSVADPDPGSGEFFYPWIRDPRWVKNQPG